MISYSCNSRKASGSRAFPRRLPRHAAVPALAKEGQPGDNHIQLYIVISVYMLHIYLSVCLSVFLFVCLSICLSIYLSLSLYIYVYIYIYMYMYACLPVCLSVRPSVRPSVCLYIMLKTSGVGGDGEDSCWTNDGSRCRRRCRVEACMQAGWLSLDGRMTE